MSSLPFWQSWNWSPTRITGAGSAGEWQTNRQKTGFKGNALGTGRLSFDVADVWAKIVGEHDSKAKVYRLLPLPVGDRNPAPVGSAHNNRRTLLGSTRVDIAVGCRIRFHFLF